MKIPSVLSWIIPPVAGLAIGWLVKSHHGQDSSEKPLEVRTVTGPPATRNLSEASRFVPLSSETAEDLRALPTNDLYERMAFFLLDAKAEDFPALYVDLKSRPHRSRELNRLFFLHWTRLDPEAAIIATRRTDDLSHVYRTWACHDPGKALATALARNEGVNEVAWGIGEFRPKWLEENWDFVPEVQRINAIAGSTLWQNTGDPESALRLTIKSKRKYSYLNEKTLLALARQDPLKAYQLVKELSGNSHSYRGAKVMDSLISALSQHEPELLGEIAKTAKSPIDRSKIRQAQFKGLLLEDPGAAKEMLDGIPDSWLKQDLSINYAKHLLESDPGEGFRYGLELLQNELSNPKRRIELRYESGSTSRGIRDADSRELINKLIDQDAPTLLNGLLSNLNVGGNDKVFQSASSEWASRDLDGYAEWIQSHGQDHKVYTPGVLNIVGNLTRHGKFKVGMEWLQSISVGDESTAGRASSLYRDWLDTDPKGAMAWRLSEDFTGHPQLFPLPTQSEEE